jgi:hypothetical protein
MNKGITVKELYIQMKLLCENGYEDCEVFIPDGSEPERIDLDMPLKQGIYNTDLKNKFIMLV